MIKKSACLKGAIMKKTKEGATAYEHSLNHALEFFSKSGSLYDTKTKKSYYEGEATAYRAIH